MTTSIKIKNNIISKNAVAVLGPLLYLRFLTILLSNVATILRSGNLQSLDKAMGVHAKKFRYQQSTFVFDCQFCDGHLREDSYSFGIAREIYIRNCYFKWLPSSAYNNARTVVDFGTNRGAFSALMTLRADHIFCVECDVRYTPLIKHNLNNNNFTKYTILNAYIGDRGKTNTTDHVPTISATNFFKIYDLESVDLIKIDIEGSEFSLFDSTNWLQRVHAITMEVHPQHGDTSKILYSMKQNGFSFVIANENLQRIADPDKASFIYAWNNS